MLSLFEETAYRHAAAQGATQIGLMLIVYDALARDLKKAGLAAQVNDIAGRCHWSNHALVILGHLESWTTYLDDPVLVASLESFYGSLRGSILQCQLPGQAAGLEALATLVLDARASWQQKEGLLLAQRNQSRGAPGVSARPESDEPTSPVRSWSA